MKRGAWIAWWISKVEDSRFDAEDLYKMFACRISEDHSEGLSATESATNCIEEIEDFIVRYSEVK